MAEVRIPPGPLSRGTAALLEELLDRLAHLLPGGIRAAAPLYLSQGPGGLTIGVDLPPEYWVQITGGPTLAGAYSWIHRQQATGGTYVDHPDGATGSPSGNPAYERNGFVIPVGEHVTLTRGYLNAGAPGLEFLCDYEAPPGPPDGSVVLEERRVICDDTGYLVGQLRYGTLTLETDFSLTLVYSAWMNSGDDLGCVPCVCDTATDTSTDTSTDSSTDSSHTSTGFGTEGGDTVTVCCCDGVALPAALHASVVGSGDCGCWSTSIALTYNSGTHAWTGSVGIPCGTGTSTLSLSLTCSGGCLWTLTGSLACVPLLGGGSEVGLFRQPPTGVSCDPFQLDFGTFSFLSLACCGISGSGGITITITT